MATRSASRRSTRPERFSWRRTTSTSTPMTGGLRSPPSSGPPASGSAPARASGTTPCPPSATLTGSLASGGTESRASSRAGTTGASLGRGAGEFPSPSFMTRRGMCSPPPRPSSTSRGSSRSTAATRGGRWRYLTSSPTPSRPRRTSGRRAPTPWTCGSTAAARGLASWRVAQSFPILLMSTLRAAISTGAGFRAPCSRASPPGGRLPTRPSSHTALCSTRRGTK
mmetsp:Transcript_6510/g.12489  ORF Transcript_6510/g.12489 Transcript_6510/m.12489 type:complete len:225 (+) Transcript_6510:718-1392(+)